jgi:hypothetical protein
MPASDVKTFVPNCMLLLPSGPALILGTTAATAELLQQLLQGWLLLNTAETGS